MFTHRKLAKEYIKNCTKTEYNKIMDEGYFTDRQAKIISFKRADNMPTWEIANRLAVSPDTISRELKIIYNRIARIIL